MKKRIKMGMVGGGEGAFIGEIHRISARLDNEIELVCGALSSCPQLAISSGENLGLSRIYSSYQEMIKEEKKLPQEEKMDFVVIVTPNHFHFPVAKMAIENGFSVLSDKPATLSLEEARNLHSLLEKTGKIYGITYNYSGYPLIQEARKMVAEGKLGKIRKVLVEYSQAWLATPLEREEHKQASWRTDPSRAGLAGCMGDIGSHSFHLSEFVSGLKIKEVAADLSSFVPERKLDDDGAVLLRLEDGARGVLSASQIAVGEENRLRLCVYGEKGGLEWEQKDPNTLLFKPLDSPIQVLRAGMPYLSKEAEAFSRLPASHPEGYIEAFANLYKEFALALREENSRDKKENNFPSILEALRGMAFIEAVVESSKQNSIWIPIKE